MSQKSRPDLIEVRGIRAVGTIGVLAEEQARAQPFEIDLTIETDVRPAAASDDIENTVNYAEAITLASRIVESERSKLLERVATNIAMAVLELDGVRAVDVVVRKLRPPVPEDVLTTAVRVHRSKLDLNRVEPSEVVAYVALGSNLGDREENLRYGIKALPGVTGVSGVYETDPVGGPDQGRYLNLVAKVETTQNPYELLDTCLAIESGAGRERTVRWGARTLDLDILLWGDATITSERLSLPHPRMWERRFVLQPLNDLAPHLLPDDWDRRLPTGGVTRVDDLAL